MLSKHNQILLLIGGLAVAASLTILGVFVATDAERSAIQSETERSMELQSVGDELAASLRDQQEAVLAYLVSGDPASVSRYAAAIATERGSIETIRAGVNGQPVLAAAFDKVTSASTAWRTDFGDPAILAVRDGTVAEREAAGRAAVNSHDDVQIATSELITALDGVDQTLHLRTNALNVDRTLATALGVAFELVAAAVSLLFVRRYGRTLERDAASASVLNRFTEVTTFSIDDAAVARSNPRRSDSWSPPMRPSPTS